MDQHSMIEFAFNRQTSVRGIWAGDDRTECALWRCVRSKGHGVPTIENGRLWGAPLLGKLIRYCTVGQFCLVYRNIFHKKAPEHGSGVFLKGLIMRLLRIQLFLACTAIAPAVSAGLSFPTAPVSVLDSVNWSQFGPEFTTLGSSFNALSVQGVSVGVQLAGTDGLTVQAGSAWLAQPSGYANGESLIWAENSSGVGSGPITIQFPARGGAGAYIQSAYPGQFTALLQVFDNGGLIGSNNYTSNANGDPLFMGVMSSTSNITKLIFSIASITPSFGTDLKDLSMGTLLLIPESSTVLACAGLMTLVVARVVKRK